MCGQAIEGLRMPGVATKSYMDLFSNRMATAEGTIYILMNSDEACELVITGELCFLGFQDGQCTATLACARASTRELSVRKPRPQRASVKAQKAKTWCDRSACHFFVAHFLFGQIPVWRRHFACGWTIVPMIGLRIKLPTFAVPVILFWGHRSPGGRIQGFSLRNKHTQRISENQRNKSIWVKAFWEIFGCKATTLAASSTKRSVSWQDMESKDQRKLKVVRSAGEKRRWRCQHSGDAGWWHGMVFLARSFHCLFTLGASKP